MCTEERKWLKAKGNDRKTQRLIFLSKRKRVDKQVQKCKRKYWIKAQTELEDQCKNDNDQFWKSVGRLGIGFERQNKIPMEIMKEDGSLSSKPHGVMAKWKGYFQCLLNPRIESEQSRANDTYTNDEYEQEGRTSNLNNFITIGEVTRALNRLKKGKAVGFDEIPSEVLQNDSCVYSLHVLLNNCFETRIIPTPSNNSIINRIQKPNCTDTRDPTGYRGIALTSSVYKAYCSSIVNERISKWAKETDTISDKQNGFRKNRSTIYHISTLTNLIESRKLVKKSNFVCFVDFRKAYDVINRTLLWTKQANIYRP